MPTIRKFPLCSHPPLSGDITYIDLDGGSHRFCSACEAWVDASEDANPDRQVGGGR